MKIKLLLFCLILSFKFIIGQSLPDSSFYSANEAFYRFDFEEAQSKFESLIEKYPSAPSGYLGIAKMHLWFFLGAQDPGEFGIFEKYASLALEKGEAMADKYPDSKEVLYLLGEINTMRAIAFTTKGSTLDAFWATKSAIGYYEDVLDLDPEFYDAYLGIGLFKYALSYVPGVFQWALSLTGLSADEELGLKYIEYAAKGGKRFQTEALFHLSKMYMDYVANYTESEKILDELLAKYPDNVLFHYQYAILKMKSRNPEEAEPALRKILELNNPYFEQTTAFSLFLLGDINFSRNNFEKAYEYYDKFINRARIVDYTGIASYRAGISLEMLGKEMDAKEYYLLGRNGNPDIADDRIAKTECQIRFSNPLTDVDKLLITVKNFLTAGKYDEIVKILPEEPENITNPEKRGVAYSYLAEANLYLGNYEKSKRLATLATKFDYEEKQSVMATSYYLLAEASLKLGENASAKVYLEEAEDRNDFENKDYIQSKINKLKSIIR